MACHGGLLVLLACAALPNMCSARCYCSTVGLSFPEQQASPRGECKCSFCTGVYGGCYCKDKTPQPHCSTKRKEGEACESRFVKYGPTGGELGHIPDWCDYGLKCVAEKCVKKGSLTGTCLKEPLCTKCNGDMSACTQCSSDYVWDGENCK